MLPDFLPLNGTKNMGAQFRLACGGAQTLIKAMVHLRAVAGADLAAGGQPSQGKAPRQRLESR